MKRDRETNEQVSADTTPLPGLARTGSSHVLKHLNADLISLRPRLLFPWLGLTVGLTLLVVAAVLLIPAGISAFAVVGIAGLLFTAVFAFMVLLSVRYDFDRVKDELTIHRFGSRQVRPLHSVLAVQLLEGGSHSGSSTESREFFTCQTNLVLDDQETARINLMHNSHLADTRNIGGELAKFLDVPLLDKIP